MKKCGLLTAFCGLALYSVTYSCPMIVELFPDPKNVSDAEGEYVEIRLDDYDRLEDGSNQFRADSLFVRFESKEILAFKWPDADRLLLVHDSSMCPPRKDLACGSLGKVSLPNSRESVWKVWSGVCMDSVTVPQPKPGKSMQRVGLTDEWVFVAGTMGVGDPEYELGVKEDSLLTLAGEWAKSLKMTEIHHCPEEPMPEWVELYNASAYPLPLDAFRFCDRGGVLGRAGDSILPYQTVLVSKDTLSLRESLGIPDIRMIQVALGFLNNVEGSLRLCFRNDVVDSVYWNKGTVACPSGFNPLTNRREFTPGFLQSDVGREIPLTDKVPLVYKLSSRVVSKKGTPLRVRVESEYDVSLSLLDSAGRRVWKFVVPSMSNEWVYVPVQENLGIGVGYVALSVGEYENVVGILVRP
ncbi:lamin tail domain-containing protein [Fibrobacter sp.]|uniref:lamin tail domain-containing protein n=1 Tax=Fibrobacter sp. TaxID=35828 RepID=UPI0025BF130A|nr:lamin tail domain-containing protein [Fibrobacter sp.]MBR3073959.1 lamin tail domain-containing protein [Fibrobacter sp.]